MTNAQTEARAIARLEFTCPDCDPYVVETNLGRYVRYADHATALAAKDEELADWRVQAKINECNYLDAVSRAERAEAQLAEALRLLGRYRTETPLGNQPHMIAHEVDDFARRAREQGGE